MFFQKVPISVLSIFLFCYLTGLTNSMAVSPIEDSKNKEVTPKIQLCQGVFGANGKYFIL